MKKVESMKVAIWLLQRQVRISKKRAILILLVAMGGVSWLFFGLSSGHRHGDSILPEVAFVTPEALRSSDCQDNVSCLSARALYVQAERRIYLRDDWSADNFHDLGFLLHEIVHHLQTIGKLKFPCKMEMELPAYALQEAFYQTHHHDPEGQVPSEFSRFTRYSCVAQE